MLPLWRTLRLSFGLGFDFVAVLAFPACRDLGVLGFEVGALFGAAERHAWIVRLRRVVLAARKATSSNELRDWARLPAWMRDQLVQLPVLPCEQDLECEG